MTEMDPSEAAGVSGKDDDERFLVVGIGGSAGSITSFREFFRHVPPDSGMAYVVILHLSPEHESHLADVLQSTAKIPVQQVRDKVRVEPDHVYVIPPNKSLVMLDGSLVLSNVTSYEERRAPIDIFFRTLADSHDSRAVCVVMSGSGSDGSMGLRRVKEYNGLVLVQEPSEAAFGEMPRNCIATGLVDYVVPAAEMADCIIRHRTQVRTLQVVEETVQPLPDVEQSLMEIFTILRLRTGHDFINYKRPTVLRRIERRMAIRDLDTLPAYAALLRDRQDEAQALLNELLISVTNFFRDRDVWEKIELTVIPKLIASKRTEEHLRVWVPGCATGEEAYTLAMLFAEKAPPNVQIFATDLDQHAIVRARDGWYSATEVADVAPERLRRFFLKDGDGYRVRRDVREIVLFAHHNLIKDPPFSHLDFISCRNLLIYLNRTAQQRALEVMHFALKPGGYLVLGTAETVDGTPSLFSLADKEAHLYQARAVERIPLATPLPRAIAPVDAQALLAAPEAPAPEAHSRERFAPINVHHRLLELYAAPSVVVDEQHEVVHVSERAGRFLQVPRGDATSNILQIVRQELRIDLRAALFQAAQKRTTVVARGLVVHDGEREERIDLVVRPALADDEGVRGFFLILFEPATSRGEEPARDAAPVETGTRPLEEELLRVRGQMRGTIEQYEVQAEEAKAANEELQAMNEELRSTAEELETSQEELQSVNEELQTVNQELKVKIDEITHASDDLRNLISSTDIGTIFVDRSLRVKLFTPRARDVFNLIAADVGRPLSDITNKLVVNGLAAEMVNVLDRLQPVERELQTRDGAWFLMRLLPYRTSDDRIDGVVLTLLDVTKRHDAEQLLRASEARQTYLVHLADALRPLEEPHAIRQEALRVLGDHLQVDRMLYAEVTPDGETFVAAESYDRGSLPPVSGRFPPSNFRMGAAALARGEALRIDDVNAQSRTGRDERNAFLSLGIVAAAAVPFFALGRWIATLSAHHGSPRVWTDEDVALLRETAERTWAAVERAKVETALRESEEKFRTLFETMDEGYVLCDVLFEENGVAADIRYVDANPAAVRMTGTQLVGRTAREVVPGLEDAWFETLGRVARTGIAERHEYFAKPLDAYYSFYVFKAGSPELPRVAAIYQDVTLRRRAEVALRESEKRLDAITNLVPDLLWIADANGETSWLNDRWFEYTGQTRQQAAGWGWMDAVHPDERAESIENYRSAVAEGRPLQQEQRIRRASGTYRWFLMNALPLRDEEGSVVRYYAAATDVDEQRVLREELEERVRERTQSLLELSVNRQQLLERLVDVTEEERRRIARELHDAMGQHLTALRVGIESLPPHELIAELKKMITRIDQSIDRLTLELRPPALDQLGLYGAISSFADEFSAASGIRVALHVSLDPGDRFSDGIESALYRVVQESLTNVWKHAAASTVSIIVERDDGALRMIIEDDGHGFDADGSEGGSPLRGRFGLLGMRERLGLVGGTFKIESEADSGGATIYVRVPLEVPEGRA